jgi:hypothetical protein
VISEFLRAFDKITKGEIDEKTAVNLVNILTSAVLGVNTKYYYYTGKGAIEILMKPEGRGKRAGFLKILGYTETRAEKMTGTYKQNKKKNKKKKKKRRK